MRDPVLHSVLKIFMTWNIVVSLKQTAYNEVIFIFKSLKDYRVKNVGKKSPFKKHSKVNIKRYKCTEYVW